MNKRFQFFALFFSFCAILFAQEKNNNSFSLHGSFQTNILFPQKDTTIIPPDQYDKLYDKFALTNTYLDLNLLNQYIDAGTRFEFLKYPLPGYESDFAGWGLPYFFVTGKYKKAQLTIGDFYEQFGTGLIFRTYEDRSLGIDNSLRGARLLLEPYDGILFKALSGKQRRYWTHNESLVWGSDLELSLDRWIKLLKKSQTFLTLGGSFVGKHETANDKITDPTYQYYLNLPENVAAYDFRVRLQKGDYTFLTEYAGKVNDPSHDNQYIYKDGSALLLSGSYAKSGLSALLQAKRSDNMSFQSKRTEDAILPSYINRLPAFTSQQIYTLATLYPYATQPDGEWAFQGSINYTFKRNSLFGGKYGTTLKLNASHIRNIDKQYVKEGYDPDNANTAYLLRGTDGYTSSFFKLGKRLYYQDIILGIDKKVSADFKLNLMYMNQTIDWGVVRKEAAVGVVKTNIFVAEGKYRLSKKTTLRSEIQYLNTKQDEGDWIDGLIELSVLPSFMFTVSDLYNAGETGIHYYKAMVSYSYKSHFVQFGYGRTRAGRDCSGGVCRDVPASRGFTLSYNYNF
jgi:hypothetical protein